MNELSSINPIYISFLTKCFILPAINNCRIYTCWLTLKAENEYTIFCYDFVRFPPHRPQCSAFPTVLIISAIPQVLSLGLPLTQI